MYTTEYDAKSRFDDVQNVVSLTDKYRVSLLQLLCCPPRYKSALNVGILIGIGQGITMSFFDDYLCTISSNPTTRKYCMEKKYNPESGILSMVFLYILVVFPIGLYLWKIESNE